jgi:hypothetical protein
MAQYRKKPVIIDAVQLAPHNSEEVERFFAATGFRAWRWNSGLAYGLVITTLEGELKAGLGDFIIRGVAGEYYPCKQEIFAATYDEVVWAEPGGEGEPDVQDAPAPPEDPLPPELGADSQVGA